MTDVTISTPHRRSWELCSAIMVYESEGSGGAYATVHRVEKHGRERRLGDGQPATKEACADIARKLGAAATLSGFTPPNLIYLGARSLLWWRPAGPARIFFNTTKSAAADQQQDKSSASLLGKVTGITAQPDLVFGITSSHWYVFATDGAGRPGPQTALRRAPYFNVWASGQICTGNVRLPETLGTSALERYERAFFESEFTHPNVHGRERLINGGGGAYAFWKGVIEDGPGKPFPVRRLVDVKLTLEQLARRLDKEQR